MSLKYRISSIGWYNFEILVQTLLKVVVGKGVASFGGSKDGGRDAFFSGSAAFPSADTRWSGRWLFQVKYVDFEEQKAASAPSSLKTAFRKEINAVLAKWRLADQAVDNYILVTNVPITASVRDSLAKIAVDSGLEGNFATIDGKEVCQFLDIYPEIRRSHPQLIGLADLDLVINKDLYVRSQAYMEQWQPRLATYVVTEAHTKALALIKKTRFVVLDGPPEAGKTTIAAALALSYAADGFQVFDIRVPNDFFRAHEATKSQVFVADDAVGSVSLDPARADDWSRDLPGVVRKLDKRHLLIWTARRYILEEALAESRLGEAVAEFPRAQEILVEVGSLSSTEKAEILYNHAKLSGVKQAYRSLIRTRAIEIVYHGNFTPERVRQLVDVVLRPKAGNAGQRTLDWSDIQVFLANPSDRWRQAYRKVSVSEQAMLAAMLDVDGLVSVDDLKIAYDSRTADVAGKLGFDNCLTRLGVDPIFETAS